MPPDTPPSVSASSSSSSAPTPTPPRANVAAPSQLRVGIRLRRRIAHFLHAVARGLGIVAFCLGAPLLIFIHVVKHLATSGSPLGRALGISSASGYPSSYYASARASLSPSGSSASSSLATPSFVVDGPAFASQANPRPTFEYASPGRRRIQQRQSALRTLSLHPPALRPRQSAHDDADDADDDDEPRQRTPGQANNRTDAFRRRDAAAANNNSQRLGLGIGGATFPWNATAAESAFADLGPTGPADDAWARLAAESRGGTWLAALWLRLIEVGECIRSLVFCALLRSVVSLGRRLLLIAEAIREEVAVAFHHIKQQASATSAATWSSGAMGRQDGPQVNDVAQFAELPPELVTHILLLAASPLEADSVPCTISRLSRFYRDQVNARIYSLVHLRTPRAFRLFRLTMALYNPQLGELVKRLQVGSDTFDGAGYLPEQVAEQVALGVGLEQILLSCPNLDDLSLDLFSIAALHTGTASLIEKGAMPKRLLTELCIPESLAVPAFTDVRHLEIIAFGLDVATSRQLREQMPLLGSLTIRYVTRDARFDAVHVSPQTARVEELEDDDDDDEGHPQPRGHSGARFHRSADFDAFADAVHFLRTWPGPDATHGKRLRALTVFAWPRARRALARRIPDALSAEVAGPERIWDMSMMRASGTDGDGHGHGGDDDGSADADEDEAAIEAEAEAAAEAAARRRCSEAFPASPSTSPSFQFPPRPATTRGGGGIGGGTHQRHRSLGAGLHGLAGGGLSTLSRPTRGVSNTTTTTTTPPRATTHARSLSAMPLAHVQGVLALSPRPCRLRLGLDESYPLGPRRGPQRLWWQRRADEMAAAAEESSGVGAPSRAPPRTTT